MKIKVTQADIDKVQQYVRCPIALATVSVKPFEFDPDAFVELLLKLRVFRRDNQSNTGRHT